MELLRPSTHSIGKSNKYVNTRLYFLSSISLSIQKTSQFTVFSIHLKEFDLVTKRTQYEKPVFPDKTSVHVFDIKFSGAYSIVSLTYSEINF